MLLQTLCIISKPWVNSNWSYSPEHSIRVRIGNFLSRVTFNYDGRPWKKIGHLFYTTSSFVHHFKAMGEFKLELQSGNQFGLKSTINFSHVTLKVDGWPWKTIGRAPLLCYFKLCASLRNHWWIQTGVTVRKRPIWVKIDNFFEPCDLEIWRMTFNKANLRDLIAATGLVILLKLDSNCRFFSRETPNLGKNWPWNLTDDLQKQ